SEKEPSRYPWRNEQAKGEGVEGSRRVQAVGGIPGLEGDASGAARLKPWQGGVP
ncbi:hypothetical protein ALC60_02668, partial [Trachymyrmex zeteki]